MEHDDASYDEPASRTMLEGFARVVSVKGSTAWLEPEMMSACGGCKSSGLCGTKSIFGSRSDARTFPLENTVGLTVGERVVVGTYEDSLLQASLAAYLVPLVVMLVAAVAGQMMTGSDGVAALGAVVGLGVGMLLARVRAGRLSRRGDLSPRFLRRAYNEGLVEDCHAG
ncbi:MAG: SoxR reducing system RseC family protein [Alphaproteobacteria bacterium]|nr:SoxR reducing system RseC family protein [Alphaproteobacteria bacterium]MBF0128628.1 SoxR reducing system RseC family protein [Alphaproteobacteria bacterium]